MAATSGGATPGVTKEATRAGGGTLHVIRVGGKAASVTFVPDPMASVVRETGPRNCTDCGAASAKLRWFPFTTYACPACAAKRDARIEREQRTGDLCLRCGQPRSICTC